MILTPISPCQAAEPRARIWLLYNKTQTEGVGKLTVGFEGSVLCKRRKICRLASSHVEYGQVFQTQKDILHERLYKGLESPMTHRLGHSTDGNSRSFVYYVGSDPINNADNVSSATGTSPLMGNWLSWVRCRITSLGITDEHRWNRILKDIVQTSNFLPMQKVIITDILPVRPIDSSRKNSTNIESLSNETHLVVVQTMKQEDLL
ncbi:hypothetical protein Tco_1295314 [Tanacetum coccineum]